MVRSATMLLIEEAYMLVYLLAVVFLFIILRASISVLAIHMRIWSLNHLIALHHMILWTTDAQRENWEQRASVSK